MHPWPWFVEEGPHLTVRDLNVFENSFAVLPHDYYDFLAETNGGLPDDEHRVHREGVLARFLSLKVAAGHPGDLMAWNERVQREFDAREVIAIAYDESGATILLVCDGPRRGQIWFQPATRPKLNLGRPWHADARELADSFAEFMASLHAVSR